VCKPDHHDDHPHKGWWKKWKWHHHWFKWIKHHHHHDHDCKPDNHGHDRDDCKSKSRDHHDDRDCKDGRSNKKWSGTPSRSIAARLVNAQSQGPAGGALMLLAAAVALFLAVTAGPRRRR
jgi:hypothetical protein